MKDKVGAFFRCANVVTIGKGDDKLRCLFTDLLQAQVPVSKEPAGIARRPVIGRRSAARDCRCETRQTIGRERALSETAHGSRMTRRSCRSDTRENGIAIAVDAE